MHPKYPNIFKPIKIGPIEIANRFYQSPHVNPLTNFDGGPTDDYIAYVIQRVKGGCGLVLQSFCSLDRSRYVLPSPHNKAALSQFATFHQVSI